MPGNLNVSKAIGSNGMAPAGIDENTHGVAFAKAKVGYRVSTGCKV